MTSRFSRSSTDIEPQRDSRVYDLGYQSYRGERGGRTHSIYALYKDSIRQAMGIGRIGREKIIPWFSISLIVMGTVVWTLIQATGMQLLGIAVSESVAALYGWLGFSIFLFAAIVGSETVCTDRQRNVLSLYLVRPLSALDYVFARGGSTASLCFIFAFLPQLFFLLVLFLSSNAQGEWISDNWQLLPRVFVISVAIGLFHGALSTLAGSLAPRRIYASLTLLGIYFIGFILNASIPDSVGGWVPLLHPIRLPVDMGDLFFLQGQTYVEWRILAFAAILAGSLVLLFWRYKRLVR